MGSSWRQSALVAKILVQKKKGIKVLNYSRGDRRSLVVGFSAIPPLPRSWKRLFGRQAAVGAEECTDTSQKPRQRP